MMKNAKKKRLGITLVLLLALLTISTTGAEEMETELQTATFAGGCFWCMEHTFDEVVGVITTTSGYIGGTTHNPSYEAVSAGGTGHTEAVQVLYNSRKVRYEDLLKVFWRNIDPTARNQQFCDRGSQYRSGIFYHDDAQKERALQSKTTLEKEKPFEGPIETEVTKATQFYPAEEYHQDYHLKNPLRYKVYRFGCGRDQRLAQLWGKH